MEKNIVLYHTLVSEDAKCCVTDNFVNLIMCNSHKDPEIFTRCVLILDLIDRLSAKSTVLVVMVYTSEGNSHLQRFTEMKPSPYFIIQDTMAKRKK